MNAYLSWNSLAKAHYFYISSVLNLVLFKFFNYTFIYKINRLSWFLLNRKYYHDCYSFSPEVDCISLKPQDFYYHFILLFFICFIQVCLKNVLFIIQLYICILLYTLTFTFKHNFHLYQLPDILKFILI